MGSDGMSVTNMAEEELGLEGRPLIVLVPFPAQGHVTPMLDLANALCGHGFRTLLVVPASIHHRLSPTGQGRPDADDDGREVMFAPIPDGLTDGTPADFFALERAMEEVMPAHFEALLRSLGGATAGEGDGRPGRLACVVVDLLSSWAMMVAARCMVPVAGFWPAMLATYSLISAAPDMVRRGLISSSGIPMGEATISDAVPCCTPALTTGDLPWLVGDLASQRARFAFWRRTLERSRTLRWIVMNTFSGERCRGVDDGPHGHGLPCSVSSLAGPRIYQVGPLAAGHSGRNSGGLSFWEEDGSCMQWLDVQRPGSVLYVSFGSWVGPIGDGSIRELALGLEATGRPFLWVVGDSWRGGLPEGYLDRVAGRGNLVRWAPQRQVLRHGAVGAYLTHCGWNSTMEAMQGGKRLLCYPVAGDQFINCRYIVEEWGIGVRLDGMRRRAVEEGVERVMGREGEELQRRVSQMCEEVQGEEGTARAAAELAAFVDELKGSWAASGAGGLVSAASHELPLMQSQQRECIAGTSPCCHAALSLSLTHTHKHVQTNKEREGGGRRRRRYVWLVCFFLCVSVATNLLPNKCW